MGKIFHVSKKGSDMNDGTEKTPFLSIQKAADSAGAGDRIIVHEGVYREWVKPRNGGLNEEFRIVYEAAEGEHVVIKGSERIMGWVQVSDNVWKVSVKNEFFGNFNPYTKRIAGDWIINPMDYEVTTGEIYLNGKSLYQAASLEDVYHPVRREISPHGTWGVVSETQ